MSQNWLTEEQMVKYVSEAEQVLLDRIPEENQLAHSFSRRFQKKMRALLCYERRSERMRKVTACTRNVAAAILLVLGIALAVTMSVEAYREKLFEIIMEIYPDLTSIRIHKNKSSDENVLVPKEPGYIPEGYEEYIREQNEMLFCIFYTNDKEEISYVQRLLASGKVLLDTEDSDISTVSKDGTELTLVKKGELSMLYWNDEKYLYTLDGEIPMKELLKMSESVLLNAQETIQ
ncbi:MAG: DUF4367 domain-containing protein [Lachnospiraceae bacterium]|nr:DUF4367 domain-containing protein [Lachnospiraceae bacterium]